MHVYGRVCVFGCTALSSVTSGGGSGSLRGSHNGVKRRHAAHILAQIFHWRDAQLDPSLEVTVVTGDGGKVNLHALVLAAISPDFLRPYLQSCPAPMLLAPNLTEREVNLFWRALFLGHKEEWTDEVKAAVSNVANEFEVTFFQPTPTPPTPDPVMTSEPMQIDLGHSALPLCCNRQGSDPVVQLQRSVTLHVQGRHAIGILRR